jgi:hypothetical protein
MYFRKHEAVSVDPRLPTYSCQNITETSQVTASAQYSYNMNTSFDRTHWNVQIWCEKNML